MMSRAETEACHFLSDFAQQARRFLLRLPPATLSNNSKSILIDVRMCFPELTPKCLQSTRFLQTSSLHFLFHLRLFFLFSYLFVSYPSISPTFSSTLASVTYISCGIFANFTHRFAEQARQSEAHEAATILVVVSRMDSCC